MTTSEYLHLLRKVYKEFFLTNNLNLGQHCWDWGIVRAKEIGFVPGDDFDIWLYGSADQGPGEIYSGCCLAISDLGKELCTDHPEEFLFYYQEISYDDNTPTDFCFGHSLLKVGDYYYDLLYPDGLLDYRDHFLWQEDEENRFYLLSPSEAPEQIGYQPEAFKLFKGLLSDYI